MTQPDPNAQSGVDGTQSGVAGQQGTGGTTEPVTDPTQSGQTPPATVSRDEYETLLRRMQASDQNNSKLQATLKAHEDAKLSETERTVNALKDAQAALAEKDKAIEDLNLQIAFLSDNTYTWHNPETALKLADRNRVEWKDGKPANVKAVLDELAKAHAYLVKPEDTSTTTSPAPTGIPMNNGKNGAGDGNRSALEDRFPALRGRVAKRG